MKPLRTSALAEGWLQSRGWLAFTFQREVWNAVAEGASGLLHATTGAGKTYAVWLAALSCYARKRDADSTHMQTPGAPPLTVLWLTPMRALAADTERALLQPVKELELDWSIGLRTGDTSSGERARQAKRFPTALITTPESLSLLLTRPDAQEALSTVRMVVVDEWHELLGNKRGVQTQLALARLRRWNPELVVWGLSATLGNLAHALEVLVPQGQGRLIQGELSKELAIDTLLPPTIERFPWAGHLGLRMLPHVVEEIETSSTALVFTNTRSQAELWYQALLDARPDWAGIIALHHGSLDRAVREWVELGLKQGALKAVVCTSSLDLGVDFLPVERVLQIGSPKGVARLMQRAGRSGHAPGRPSRVTLVPTHSLELVESIAAQDAVEARHIEARVSPEKSLDVLVQHLVTVALGGGFNAEALYAEVRTAWAYRHLKQEEWEWALAFVRHGGHSLTAYPDYRRAIPDENGVWHVPDRLLAKRHRMSVGTIVSDASMAVKFWSKGGGGAALGSVEESFIARLAPGDHFLFGGRLLELVRVQDMTAYVQKASGKKPAVPRWNGGRMPLSTELADAMVARLGQAATGRFEGPEMELVRPLLETQCAWSALPTEHTLLAEVLKSREGWHLFLYPYAGRSVHLGLASVLAWRIGQHRPGTFSIAVNDYGLELLSATEIAWDEVLTPALFGTEHLLHDVLASLNATQLAQRRFREIARIAGLIFQGYPGAPKSTKQLQASSSLFFEVFRKYDPHNLLLTQAQQEVLRQELEVARLEQTLQRMSRRELQVQRVARPTPFAFPLLVERFRESLSSEKLADRIARMVRDLEKAAGGETHTDEAGMQAQARFSVAEAKRGSSSSRERRPRRVRKTGRPSSEEVQIIPPRPRHGF